MGVVRGVGGGVRLVVSGGLRQACCGAVVIRLPGRVWRFASGVLWGGREEFECVADGESV